MATDADPVVGNWYQHLDKGQKFEVVALDEDQGTVDIQHFDGDLEEIDIDAWYEMEIEPTEAPENWSGPIDDFDKETLDYTETDMNEADWQSPLEEQPQPRAGVRKQRGDYEEDAEEGEEEEDIEADMEARGWHEEE